MTLFPFFFFFFYFLAANQVDAIHVTQLERDTVLVCLDSKYGSIKIKKNGVSERV